MRETSEQKAYDAGYDIGFFDGAKEARQKIASRYIPETIEITIAVRGTDEKVEMIRRLVTFDMFKQSKGKALRLEMEDTFAAIATQGILKDLVLNN